MLSRRGRDGFRAESLNSLKQMGGERGKDRWRGMMRGNGKEGGERVDGRATIDGKEKGKREGGGVRFE